MRVTSHRVLIAAAALCVAGCRNGASAPGTGTAAGSGASTGPALFSERAAYAGLDFVHVNGMSGELYYAEIFAPGVALLDYDNDGDLDAYLVQGQALDPRKTAAARSGAPSGNATPAGDRLFRNDLVIGADGTRTLRFTDVTARSGIVSRGYGMGVAVGDIDNDGWPDLYLARLGPDQLFRNNGDGTFADISVAAGTTDPGWGVSASFLDFDRDGWLDLYVGNYVRYSVETDLDCTMRTGQPDYCFPGSYQPQPDRLYRNRGNGTFADVTGTALLGSELGPALGVATADFNGDGWADIYVANDGLADFLWVNQKNGTFRNDGLLAGVAFNGDGKATASMGVDAGDFDNDGDEDVFHANFTAEGHTLLLNDGQGLFEDVSRARGLTAQTLPFTGFGAAWLDYDNDGWLDILTVNGSARTIEALARANDPFPLHQRRQLLRNTGTGRFADVSATAGAAFEQSRVGRGAAFGDVDNDGDVDVLVGNNNGAAELLVNEVGQRRRWVGLRLVGGQGRRDMLGARVAVVLPDGRTLWRRVRSDGSYASANDPRVLAGLGDSQGPVTVRVVWPDGRSEQWTGVAIDRFTTLQSGTGR